MTMVRWNCTSVHYVLHSCTHEYLSVFRNALVYSIVWHTVQEVQTVHIIVMAIPKDYYKDQPMELLQGKIVVDVSNRTTVHRKEGISQAEYLQSLLPRSAVIKAFNVLSAYALESGGIQGKHK